VFNIHYDGRWRKFNYRTSLTVGTRAFTEMLGLTGAGVTGGGHRFRASPRGTDDPDQPFEHAVSLRRSASGGFRRLRKRSVGALRPTTVTAVTLPNHRGNANDSNGQKGGAAPDASLVSLKVLDANGNGPPRSAPSSALSSGCSPITRRTIFASSTCRWRASQRVVLDRSADARGQARR